MSKTFPKRNMLIILNGPNYLIFLRQSGRWKAKEKMRLKVETQLIIPKHNILDSVQKGYIPNFRYMALTFCQSEGGVRVLGFEFMSQ